MVAGHHAEHVHDNCDCQIMVKKPGEPLDIEGYDPDALKREYKNTSGKTSKDSINEMRHADYTPEKSAKRNARRRELYAQESVETSNLGAGGGYSELPPPSRVNGASFDPSDKSDVRRVFDRYREQIRTKPVEHAYILTSGGEIWHAVGDNMSVNIDGAPLDGAIVMHNHVPRDGEPAWTFSGEDLKKAAAVSGNPRALVCYCRV